MTAEQAPAGRAGGGAGRQVYFSDPDAPDAGQLSAEFERLAGRVYVQARGGVVDFDAAFDLACFLIEWGPADPLARELADLSAEQTCPALVREAALRVLADRYEPASTPSQRGWLPWKRHWKR